MLGFFIDPFIKLYFFSFVLFVYFKREIIAIFAHRLSKHTILKLNQKILILLGFFLISLNLSAQCSMCRAVLESDADGAAAEGINNGILYLMSFPYLLVGFIGFFIYRSRQKAKLEEKNQ